VEGSCERGNEPSGSRVAQGNALLMQYAVQVSHYSCNMLYRFHHKCSIITPFEDTQTKRKLLETIR
jgi:hypothetical protein